MPPNQRHTNAHAFGRAGVLYRQGKRQEYKGVGDWLK